MNHLFIELTQDKYALPVRVTDTQKEMADLTGLTQGNIRSQVSRGTRGFYQYPRFIKINIEEDEK